MLGFVQEISWEKYSKTLAGYYQGSQFASKLCYDTHFSHKFLGLCNLSSGNNFNQWIFPLSPKIPFILLQLHLGVGYVIPRPIPILPRFH